MFDIVHKLFSRPLCGGGGGVSVGWIGLSEAEVRPALLIISWTKYRVPAWKRGRLKKKKKNRQEDEASGAAAVKRAIRK